MLSYLHVHMGSTNWIQWVIKKDKVLKSGQCLRRIGSGRKVVYDLNISYSCIKLQKNDFRVKGY